MKNNLIKNILMIMLIMICGISTTSCNNTKKPKPEDNLVNLNIDFMKHMEADITGATALTISRELSTNKARNMSVKNLSDDETESKTYLYKTDVIYGSGDITYDDVNLLQVTFTKNTNVTEEVYDADGNLIGTNTVVTQDQIPAQINKLCVTEDYTFLQFIPVLEGEGPHYYKTASGELKYAEINIRPSNDSLVAERYSVATGGYAAIHYDNINYFSDEVHKSFILDNESGLIYVMEGIYITEIANGLIYGSDGLIYDMRVGAEGEMEFYTLYQNTTIKVTKSFKDGNGHIFIENDSVNAFDEANGIMFYKSDQENHYLLSKEGTTVHLRLQTGIETSGVFSLIDIKQIGAKWDELEIADTEFLTFESEISTKSGHFRIQIIEGGMIYVTKGSSEFIRYDILSKQVETQQYYGGLYDAVFLSYKTVLILDNDMLYHGDVYGPNAFQITWNEELEKEEANFEALTLLLVNCDYTYGDSSGDWGSDYTKLVFRVTDLAGTEYYVIKLLPDGTPSIVKQSEYVADNQKVITLQPINR